MDVLMGDWIDEQTREGRCNAMPRVGQVAATVLLTGGRTERPPAPCEVSVEGHGSHHEDEWGRKWVDDGPDVISPVLGRPSMHVPTKQREGDQVLPSGDLSQVDDQALLIQDIEWRRQVGIERYGQGHRPFNGRDTLLDAYEELLDLLVYTRSLRRMAAATREELIAEVAKAFHPEPDGEDEATAAIAVDRIMGWVVSQLDQKESK